MSFTDQNIKYLLKFVDNEEYAKDLVNGKLFMRPIGYYHNNELNNGQSDIFEGAPFHEVRIYKNKERPVYCMTAVYEDEVDGNVIAVDSKMIEQFECQRGFAVVLDYNKFCLLIKNIECAGHAIRAGIINYGSPTLELGGELLIDTTEQSAFIKHSMYKYQSEYRILIAENVKDDHIIHIVQGGMSDSVVGVYSIETMDKSGNCYYINLADGVMK